MSDMIRHHDFVSYQGISAAWVPCEALERCGAKTQGDANPLVSVADVLGLGVTTIASAEQDIHAMGMTVTCTYPGMIRAPEKLGNSKK